MTRPLLGLLLIALALLSVLLDAKAALAGWLAAFALVSAVPLGALCLSMMVRIIPGPWRDELAGPCEEATSLLPVLALMALPILIGMRWLYPWFDAEQTGFKAIYLSPLFFGLRALAILIGAAALGIGLMRTESYRLAIAGLIVFVLLQNILAVDLILSLTPEFHSSGFGLYMLGLQMLTALAVLTLYRLPASADPSLLGRLLMTALLFWAYFSFMQYFISWSSNLPPGAKWFALRGHGVWAVAEYAMAALRLAAGLLLFFPPVRGSRQWLTWLSVAILAGSIVESAWLTLPSAGTTSPVAPLAYLLALAGMILVVPSARFRPFAGRRAA